MITAVYADGGVIQRTPAPASAVPLVHRLWHGEADYVEVPAATFAAWAECPLPEGTAVVRVYSWGAMVALGTHERFGDLQRIWPFNEKPSLWLTFVATVAALPDC